MEKKEGKFSNLVIFEKFQKKRNIINLEIYIHIYKKKKTILKAHLQFYENKISSQRETSSFQISNMKYE